MVLLGDYIGNKATHERMKPPLGHVRFISIKWCQMLMKIEVSVVLILCVDHIPKKIRNWKH